MSTSSSVSKGGVSDEDLQAQGWLPACLTCLLAQVHTGLNIVEICRSLVGRMPGTHSVKCIQNSSTIAVGQRVLILVFITVSAQQHHFGSLQYFCAKRWSCLRIMYAPVTKHPLLSGDDQAVPHAGSECGASCDAAGGRPDPDRRLEPVPNPDGGAERGSVRTRTHKSAPGGQHVCGALRPRLLGS